MEVHSGQLTVKISGLLKDKVFLNHWCKLYSGKSSIAPRLEVFENPSSIDPKSNKKSIDLENCQWKKVDTIDPAFSIIVKSKQCTFIAPSATERAEWLVFLQCISPDLSRQSITSDPDSSAMTYEGMIMQNNVLYSSTNETPVYKFDVVADRSKGSCAAFHFEGIYTLLFDDNTITMLKHDTDKKVAVWDYYCIRTYGHSAHTVSFHVGKTCSTGVGLFSFITTEGKRIVEIITQQTKKIRDKDSLQSNPSEVSSVSPASASKPPVFPKNKLTATNSSASTKSDISLTSDSAVSSQTSGHKKPALKVPISPSGSSSSSESSTRKNSSGFEANFKQQLSQSLANPSSPTYENSDKPLKPAVSVESLSSTLSKTEKKRLKALDKEAKQREKQETKERLKREKEREKREREEQKVQKKLQKNANKKEALIPSKPLRPVSQIDEHTYALADDDYVPSRPITNRASGNNDYSDVDFPQVPSRKLEMEPKYSDPWQDLLSSPVTTSFSPEEDPDYIYSLPEKKQENGQQRKTNVCDSYEEFDVSQNVTPPEIPKKLNGEDNLSNSDIYDHFNAPNNKAEQQENVYGIESASAIFSSKNKQPENKNKSRVVKEDNLDTSVYETL